MLFKVLFFLLCIYCTQCAQYEPSWESLDSRPLPRWYDDCKIGIFVHWGVFSVPSLKSEWFWYYWKEKHSVDVENFMRNNYPPNFSYQNFGKEFTAEFYDPEQWADIIAASGAKYVVLTTKHHEGFTLWPSKTSFSWNSMDIGPKKDLVQPLAEAIKNRSGLHFGVYHSLYEWFNPLWLHDKANAFKTNKFAKQKAIPELYELVNMYKPEIIWSDGEAEATDVYWGSKEFLTWLYNDSPVKDTVVVNDRWGIGTSCKHGGFYNCEDRFNPGSLQAHKWENALTLDKSSWGYRRNSKSEDFLTINDLLENLAQTISFGGNLLINIGPTKEGTISPIYEERLRQLGFWLSVNGEAVYGTKPWVVQRDSYTKNVWYVQKSNNVFAIFLPWPSGGTLILQSVTDLTEKKVHLLGYNKSLPLFVSKEKLTYIQLPLSQSVKLKWAYVLKFNTK